MDRTAPDQHVADLARFSPYVRLLDRRIVFLRGALEETTADDLAAQLLALEMDSDDPITLYIDSPGGNTFGMFALYDTIQLLHSPVHTTCIGMGASAAAFLLATGTGTRSATPNARIMLHQPHGGGIEGKAADIQILAREFAFLRTRMEEILAERTGKTPERISKDTNRDFWLSAAEAKDYGIIDEVVSVRPLKPVR
jgi:ATP-dependent Clp protease protease subunit